MPWPSALPPAISSSTQSGCTDPTVKAAARRPIAAAGLVSDVGHGWLWKLAHWFHAAAFTPTVVVLVLGIGIQMSNGVAAGLSDGVAAARA